MYKIEKHIYGFKLTFGGFIMKDEMQKWQEESMSALKGQAPNFKVFIDMRTMKVVPDESRPLLEAGQKLYKQAGMQRSVVILANPMAKLQFKEIAKQTGIYQWERYIDASSTPDWEKIGKDWIEKGIDPDNN